MSDPSETVAYITGASRGVGRLIAIALAGDGAQVVGFARRSEDLDSLRDERAGALRAYPCHMDELGIKPEACVDCGFVWDDLNVSEIRERLSAMSARLTESFASGEPRLTRRPSPDVWSPLEYGSHVRDVLLNLRDRLVVGLAEDNPSPKPMYGTLRIDRGMYGRTEPAELVTDLTVAARLFDQTLSTLSPEDSERPIFYGWPRPATRTLRWVAAQALHEVEHHLDDVERTFPSS